MSSEARKRLEETEAICFALAHASRRQILMTVHFRGGMSAGDIAARFHHAWPTISRHLKVLEQAGLISRGRDGQRRPCRLRPEPLAEIAAWAEHTRVAWEHRLDRLDAHLQRTRTESHPR